MDKFAKYIQRAKRLGIKEAKIIPARSIVTAEWVRMKCQFGCDGYGGCLTCPPNSPTPEETKKVLANYKYALLAHVDKQISITTIVARLERELFFDGYYKALGLGAGPCNLCEECADTCKHAEKARPSMEACGIDVFSTVRAHGFPIEPLRTQNCQGNYYGVVLIE
ncbi:DUF2284 domain-containing protein [Candidatus Omnitrophota bacterium]